MPARLSWKRLGEHPATRELHMAKKAGAGMLGVALTVGLSACGGAVNFQDKVTVAVAAPAAPEPVQHELVEITLDHIEIKDKILFEIDKAEIRPESFELLNQVVAILQENPRVKEINVIGHTDNDGAETYNQQLSERRAASVRAYLVEHGVPEVRLTSEGRGEGDPVASNDHHKGREKNRRVEFLITDQELTKQVSPDEAQKLQQASEEAAQDAVQKPEQEEK